MQELLIDTIRTDGTTQSRSRINDDYVQELTEAIQNGTKLPAVCVYHDGSDIWMADGFHRILAHVRADKKTIKAEVKKGTRADAIWTSCGSNLEHGLRRTNDDKRAAVKLGLKAKPNLSDRAMAEHCGVSDRLVWKIRKELNPKKTPPAPRTGVDGITRKVPPPPPPAKQEQAPRPPPPGMQPPEKKSPKKEHHDEVGQPIPDHLWPIWDARTEINGALRLLSSAKAFVKSESEKHDGLLIEGNHQAITAALTTAYDGLKANIPHAVCPWCRGIVNDSCGGCQGRGMIGKFRYDTTIPEELK